LQAVNFEQFEEDFKLGLARQVKDEIDGIQTPNTAGSRKFSKKPELLSLMDANRNRNAAIGNTQQCVSLM